MSIRIEQINKPSLATYFITKENFHDSLTDNLVRNEVVLLLASLSKPERESMGIFETVSLPSSQIVESDAKKFVNTVQISTWDNKVDALYVQSQIAALVDSSPDTLNTLNELATALGNDPNFATTILDQVSLKPDKFIYTVGDGRTKDFVMFHNFGTRDVIVSVRQTAAPYAMVYTDIECTTDTSITVRFAESPMAGQYRVTIIG